MNVIKVQKLSKKFRIYQSKPALIHLWKNREYKEIWALKDVSFKVGQGETVAIIGKNGSGKSTLLKILSGVMAPTYGSVKIEGKVASLLELGAGFHPELTGRENVYLNASIMNLTMDEIKDRFNDIVEFSGLKEFMEVPLYTYSSGMYVRLGFAIAVQAQFDILIIDEIISVGDIGFQEKCFNKIMDFKRAGKTIIFVTHDTDMAEKIADRILWLEQGELRTKKEKRHLIDSYLEMFSKEDEKKILEEEKLSKSVEEKKTESEKEKEEKVEKRWGSYEAEITKVTFYNQHNKKTRIFKTGDTLRVVIEYIAHKKIKSPIFGTAIHTIDGVHITGPNTDFSGYKIDYIEGKGSMEYIIHKLPLLKGDYLLTVAIYDYTNIKPIDHHDKMYKFKVSKGECKEKYGIIKTPCEWRHNRIR